MARDFGYEQAKALALLSWAAESGEAPWLPTTHRATVRALERRGLRRRAGLADRGWANDTLPQRQLDALTAAGREAVAESASCQNLLGRLRERGTIT